MAEPIRASIGMSPAETLEFFRAKGEYPVSERWWEVWQEEHARAFTVAGVTDRTVLENVRASLDKVLAQGGTLNTWKKQIVGELKAAVDAGTAPENILSQSRLRTIYDTNLRMARAAGKWKRIEATKGVSPFLMYSAVMDDRTRPMHRAWHGTILPVDHPWWDTHFPPCGWLCRCDVVQLSQADLDIRGLKVSVTPPDDGPARSFVRGDGSVESAPAGIDPGFAYNVGKAHMRGLVPRPVDSDIIEPQLKVDAAALPEQRVRTRPADTLLPAETIADEATAAWKSACGQAGDGAVIIVDPTGQQIVIDEGFWLDANGKTKITKRGRHRFVNLIAEALRQPDEIWSDWEQDDASKRPAGTAPKQSFLVRRYLARFKIDDEDANICIIMQIGRDGWRSITAFDATNRAFEKRRGGVLQYRRNDENE